MLAPNPAAMPMPSIMPSPKFHDVTIVRKREYAQAKVEPVPPEEFGISRNARSIRTSTYCFHRVLRNHADLVAQGYDEDQVKTLPTYVSATNIEQTSRDTVNESTLRQSDDGLNEANRQTWITEHYIRMDYEGNGKARMYRVTTGGAGSGDDQIMRRDGEEEIVEIDHIPFAAMTPVIMTHRFFGRSVADLVMDIQRIKTALLRSLLDNAYIANNPRTEVAESHATETTLDDLLISRPGGIVRTRQPGGLNILQHPDIGSHVFPLLQYQDATREWRTGVSRQGQGVDPNALQNQVATIANQMFNAAQAKMKLIARIFAETGIKDLFTLLHATIRRHGGQASTVRLRNQWVDVDPREWKARNDMTVNVGLGTGSKAEQLQQLQLIIAAQEKAIAAGMISPKNLWNSAQELVRLIGRKDPEAFFTKPGAPVDPQDQASQPIQPPSDPKMMELQAKAEIEKVQAQADIQTQRDKTQMEAALQQQKFQFEAQLAEKQAELDARIKAMEAEFAREKHQAEMQAKAVDIQSRHAEHGMRLEQSRAKAEAGTKPAVQVQYDGAPLANALAEMGRQMAEHRDMMTEAMKRMSAPKKIRKGKDGSWQQEPA